MRLKGKYRARGWLHLWLRGIGNCNGGARRDFNVERVDGGGLK